MQINDRTRRSAFKNAQKIIGGKLREKKNSWKEIKGQDKGWTDFSVLPP